MTEWNLDDPRWRERVGNSAELAFRQAVRLSIDLRDKEVYEPKLTGRRALFLNQVLGRLGELAGFDTEELWERD